MESYHQLKFNERNLETFIDMLSVYKNAIYIMTEAFLSKLAFLWSFGLFIFVEVQLQLIKKMIVYLL